MYELTCPLCRHKMLTPLARPNAMAKCRRCLNPFRVQRNNVKHTGSWGHASVDVFPGHEPIGVSNSVAGPPTPAEATGALAIQSLAAGRASRSSGSSVAGQRDRRSPPADYASPVRTMSRGRELAMRQTRRRQLNTLLWMTMLLILVGGAVGLGIYVREDLSELLGAHFESKQPYPIRRGGIGAAAATGASDGRSASAPPSHANASDEGSDSVFHGEDRPSPILASGDTLGMDHPALSDPQEEFFAHEIEIKRVSAQRLPQRLWREVDEPYVSPVQTGPLQIVNERVTTEETGRLVFSAEVQAVNTPLVRSATAELALVGFDDRIFARVEVDLPTLSSRRPQQIEVPIPDGYSKRTMRVVSSARGSAVPPDSVVISSALVETTGAGAGTSVRVTVINPSEYQLTRAVFFLAALNDQGQPIARWRMTWPGSIGPGDQVVFTADTPLESKIGVHQWDVVGLGRLPKDARLSPADGFM